MPHETREEEIGRFTEFAADSVRLDKLVNAHRRDQAFLRDGGEIKYTPDHSLWGSFFYPVRHGGPHKSRDGKVFSGFAVVFSEADKSSKSFVEQSVLTSDLVSGMLGKILMDQIVDLREGSKHNPDFFLTNASRVGLEKTIEVVLRDLRKAKSATLEKTLNRTYSELKVALEEMMKGGGTEKEFRELAINFPKKYPKLSLLLHDDQAQINLVERVELFNEIGLFDWDHVQSLVLAGEDDEDTFGLEPVDVERFEELSEKYKALLNLKFSANTDKNEDFSSRNEAMAEVLAMNAIVRKRSDTRFNYLTTSNISIIDFDGLFWNKDNEGDPLEEHDYAGDLPSVSQLFVRHPICFLSDIELQAREVDSYAPLARLVDTIVPKVYTKKNRLWENQRNLKKRIARSLEKQTDEKIEVFDRQLKQFLLSWSNKKMPWVDVFWEQRARTWQADLEELDIDGENFREFWQKLNDRLATETWPLGIYLSMTRDGHISRASPLVFIDCDRETDTILQELQEGVYTRRFPQLQDKIEEFNEGVESRSKYFTYLVNAVVFMSADQFETADDFASMATEVAYASEEEVITGREAYYLRSLLTRICARGTQDLEIAKKLMLIAKSKLAEDNHRLEDDRKVSQVRFDLENWSREIVQGLFVSLKGKSVKPLGGDMLTKYIAYMTKIVKDDLAHMSQQERGAAGGHLFAKICDKAKFNFLVLCTMVEHLPQMEEPLGYKGKARLIQEWNRQYTQQHSKLKISITSEVLRGLSTVEEAYYLAIACACQGADFVNLDGGLPEQVTKFFGPEGTGVFDENESFPRQKDIQSASTSTIDKNRYNYLKTLCYDALNSDVDLEEIANAAAEDSVY